MPELPLTSAVVFLPFSKFSISIKVSRGNISLRTNIEPLVKSRAAPTPALPSQTAHNAVENITKLKHAIIFFTIMPPVQPFLLRF